jgi:hypothetical protein
MKVDDSEIVKIKRHASGAMCASIFSFIVSLVSIIFALEVYAIHVAGGGCI